MAVHLHHRDDRLRSGEPGELDAAALPSRPEQQGWLRSSKLAIACFAIFVVFWAAQSVTGWHAYNADQQEHAEQEVAYVEYLTTGDFVEATFENWESEFLQMGAFVLLTAFLVQKGSSESKKSAQDDSGDDSDAHRTD